MVQIPPREPIEDTFEGALLRYATAYLLAPEPLARTEIVAQGAFTLRYGLRYLETPSKVIVPGLLALDYGEFLTGEDMWDFLLTRHNMFPRSEVVGHRADGAEDMIVLKRLDFDAPKAVFVYQSADAVVPLARLDAAIGRIEAPERLLEYVPHYEALEDWTRRE